ncbi:ATP-binding protein, partial [archaeon]|nr:ATP-binding protein [archaeon]
VIPEITGELRKIRAVTQQHQGGSISRNKLKEVVAIKKENSLLNALADSDIFWEQIAQKNEFTPDYGFVYDFSVAEHHNFIANGFFVHNTASAVKDEFGDGGWVLKAGALVLASGGAAMVDEFDKMDPEDRSAMHEAMEQQKVSIAKAGIVTRFKTETSILAAANPKFGRFDEYENPLTQINLPPALFSRFDLYFMIRDVLDKAKDAQIAEHILKAHQAGELLHNNEVNKNSKLSKKRLEEIIESVSPEIKPDTLKKFIAYGRQKCFPVMSEEVMKRIAEFYVGLREEGRQQGGAYAATHRQLEALVRLSEASARVRLKNEVELEDVERAVKLFKKSLSEVGVDPDTKKFDIDLITTGKSHSQLTNMKKILSIVKEKSKEFDAVPIEQIIEEAAKQGIDADKTKDFVAELHKKGELYETRHGLFKPTQKESF